MEDLRRVRRELDDLCQQRELGWSVEDAERYQELCILERYLLEAA